MFGDYGGEIPEFMRSYLKSTINHLSCLLCVMLGMRMLRKILYKIFSFKLFESSRSLPDNFQLKSWFYKVARNAAVDYLRHLQVEDKYKFLMAEAMINVPDMDEEIDEQVYDKVNLAIESLPEQCRLIIKLNVLEGKKYQEIAEELGITINTIRTQVSRGYKKLREILAEEMDTSILIYMFLKNK